VIALTRDVSPALGECELTHLERTPIDVVRAVVQHAGYEQLLERLGCRVHRLPAAADIPDSVFIEDTAVVLEELAVLARPGAASRRCEVAAVADALRPHRELRAIAEPATLDGGDVLVARRSVFVGRSSRTNAQGIEQLRGILEPLGYSVVPVKVAGYLHLKSAVTGVGDGTLLVNPVWVSPAPFEAFELLPVDPDEPGAANVVRVREELVMPAAFPRTRARLESRGYRVHTVDVSELAKAEGAVTCCSLLIG
jgi:dimethylargininase